MKSKFKNCVFAVFTGAISVNAVAQTDTLRIMSQNVLYYGNGCQGPTWKYNSYLKTIVGFAQPDVYGMVKLASIATSADDKAGTAPVGFADSILQFAMNAASPGKYAYCPFTNVARSNNQAVLFYNQNKLGFVSIVSSYINVTDFNTYKLYYKDPNLANTHDTTFLYITLNHDKSGKENEKVRAEQIGEEMKYIKEHFTHLPNYINMGDFNIRSSKELLYEALTENPDSNFRLSDPPFNPDHTLSYPANWEKDPAYAAYFTTSTRESENVPNSCGSGGGAKDWYDHIFISPWLVNNANYMKYIPHSYKTIGNDGHRYRKSINDNGPRNTSAPENVIEALYQFSNKYPVMIDLEVTQNKTGRSPKDPEIPMVKVLQQEEINISGAEHLKAKKPVLINFPETFAGQEINIELFDAAGKSVQKETITVKGSNFSLKQKLAPGNYNIKFTGKHNLIAEKMVVIE